MVAFASNKFNPDTDSDRPKLGDTVEVIDKKWVIQKIDWMSARKLIEGKEPDSGEFDMVFLRPHALRPFVIWVIYVNEVKS